MRPCFYCGEPMQRPNRRGVRHSKLERTEDHVIPKSRGGRRTAFWLLGAESSTINNIVLCHRKCNEDKGDRTLEEYRVIVAERKGIPAEQFIFPGERS